MGPIEIQIKCRRIAALIDLRKLVEGPPKITQIKTDRDEFGNLVVHEGADLEKVTVVLPLDAITGDPVGCSGHQLGWILISVELTRTIDAGSQRFRYIVLDGEGGGECITIEIVVGRRIQRFHSKYRCPSCNQEITSIPSNQQTEIVLKKGQLGYPAQFSGLRRILLQGKSIGGSDLEITDIEIPFQNTRRR